MFRYLEKHQLCTVPFCFSVQNQQNYLPGLATFTQIYVRNMLSVNPHAVNVLPDTTKTPKQKPNFKVQFLKLCAQYTEKVSCSFFYCHLYSDSILPKTTSQSLPLPPLCQLTHFLSWKFFSSIRNKMVNYHNREQDRDKYPQQQDLRFTQQQVAWF